MKRPSATGWFQTENDTMTSPLWGRLGGDAYLLYQQSLQHCGRHLTEGRFTLADIDLTRFVKRPWKAVAALIAEGLWTSDVHVPCEFRASSLHVPLYAPDWNQHVLSRDQVEKYRRWSAKSSQRFRSNSATDQQERPARNASKGGRKARGDSVTQPTGDTVTNSSRDTVSGSGSGAERRNPEPLEDAGRTPTLTRSARSASTAQSQVHPAPRADTTIQNGRITMSRDEEFPFYDDDVPMGEGLHWADASDDDDDDVG